MSEIDRENFGRFIQERRKEKGYTQKELARQLFLSDKAVSKWERGISLPDIQVLIPLADLLGVTVTELLEGRRMESGDEMKAGDVEDLVKKALALSKEPPKRDKRVLIRHGLIYAAALTASVFEMMILFWSGCTLNELGGSGVLVTELLSVIFGAYFWFGMKEQLPAYYDENKISVYTDGIFEMNIPGVYFNNGNWPHIVRTVRIWSVASMVAMPMVSLLVHLFLPKGWWMAELFLFLLLFLGGMFIPIYIVGNEGRQQKKSRNY